MKLCLRDGFFAALLVPATLLPPMYISAFVFGWGYDFDPALFQTVFGMAVAYGLGNMLPKLEGF